MFSRQFKLFNINLNKNMDGIQKLGVQQSSIIILHLKAIINHLNRKTILCGSWLPNTHGFQCL